MILPPQYRVGLDHTQYLPILNKHWMECEISKEDYDLLKGLGRHYIYRCSDNADHDESIRVEMWDWVSFIIVFAVLSVQADLCSKDVVNPQRQALLVFSAREARCRRARRLREAAQSRRTFVHQTFPRSG